MSSGGLGSFHLVKREKKVRKKWDWIEAIIGFRNWVFEKKKCSSRAELQHVLPIIKRKM